MTLICPSKWLAKLFERSYLSCYPIEVIKNSVDTSIFKPTYGNFRSRLGIEGKKIILGVSGFWEAPTKGFVDFLALSKLISKDVRIVLVGLTPKLMKNLPANVIGIGRTNSAEELAEAYTAADVFFNPTRLDNFPTVNLEAAACGCPIVTYDSGGCPETVEGYANAEILSGDEKCPEGFLTAAKRRGFL